MRYGRQSVYQQKFADETGIFFTEEEFPELKNATEDVSGVLMKAIQKILYTPDNLEKYTDNCKLVQYETTESYYEKLIRIYQGLKA